MVALFFVFVFLLGTAVGSFLNVLVLRIGTGLGFSKRSFCFSCGENLAWYELIPFVSFLIQKGRCRRCKTKISFHYAVVELISGAVFVLIWVHEFGSFGVVELRNYEVWGSVFYYWVIFSLLIAISLYDFLHKIIPDTFVYLFISLSFLNVFGLFNFDNQSLFWHLLSGPILFTPFAFLWFVSRGRSMGLGDGKLAWGIGWLLGISSGVAAVAVSFWVGAFVGIGLLCAQRFMHLLPTEKRFTIKSEIPFGPFLALGALAAFFFDLKLMDLVFV